MMKISEKIKYIKYKNFEENKKFPHQMKKRFIKLSRKN